MKLTFTLNQLELYALSESRYWDFYHLARSYAGIPVGNHWGNGELGYFLNTELIRNWDEELGEAYVSMRGNVFFLKSTTLSIRINQLMTDLKLALNAVHDGSGTLKDLRETRKLFVQCLDQVEW